MQSVILILPNTIKQILRTMMTGERNVIEHTAGLPATAESLTADLISLSVQTGSTVLVHSSLRSLGWVCGGPIAVIEALLNVVGATGTIVMPSHSGSYSEPSLWTNPPVPKEWWPVIRATMPSFQPEVTPTLGMGAVAECFRTLPNVLRSHHPHVSFSALGPQASFVTADHELVPSLGDTSPLGRLYDVNAFVLLLGVGHNSNTSLHLAEGRAYEATARRQSTGGPMLIDGQRKWVEFDDFDYDDDAFPEVGRNFALQTDHVRSGKVGVGTALLMPQKELVDFGVAWMKDHQTRNNPGAEK